MKRADWQSVVEPTQILGERPAVVILLPQQAIGLGTKQQKQTNTEAEVSDDVIIKCSLIKFYINIKNLSTIEQGQQ